MSYPVQRAAKALYGEEGQLEIKALITHYLGRAAILAEAIRKVRLQVFGGANAPYLWVKTPVGYDS